LSIKTIKPYERRNQDLDPQLVWRGKDKQDWSDLVVSAPPLYIQEKVPPQVIIEDLRRQSQERSQASQETQQLDLFADFIRLLLFLGFLCLRDKLSVIT